MSLTNYIGGRKSYRRSQFRMAVHEIIHKRRQRIQSWIRCAQQLLKKKRSDTLLFSLKQLGFQEMILQSGFFKQIRQKLKDRRQCQQCGSLNTVFRVGLCMCHLCEDWFWCSGGSGPLEQICKSCKNIQNVDETHVRRWDYYRYNT